MTTSAIINAMQMLSEEYGSRFTVSESRIQLWEALLSGFDGECILAAVTHLVATGDQWSPTIGQIRELCIDVSEGRLQRPSADDAWLKVTSYCSDERGKLDRASPEWQALKSIGGSWNVNHSQNPDFARAQFVKAFDSIVQQRRNERASIPAVHNYLEKIRAQLPGTSIAQERQLEGCES